MGDEAERIENDTRKEEEKRKITKKSPTFCSPHRRASGFPKRVIWRWFVRVAILQSQEHAF